MQPAQLHLRVHLRGNISRNNLEDLCPKIDVAAVDHEVEDIRLGSPVGCGLLRVLRRLVNEMLVLRHLRSLIDEARVCRCVLWPVRIENEKEFRER